MNDYEIVAGDLLPVLSINLYDGEDAYDPTAADEVRVKVWQNDTLLLNKVASTIDPSGLVTYAWVATETDVPGPFKVRVVLTFGDRTETFPPDGYMVGHFNAATPTG